jgi:Lipocalin-like domain
MNRNGRGYVKAIQIVIVAAFVSCALAQERSAPHSAPGPSSDRAKLIGAWHLVSIKGPDGKPVQTAPLGMLIYTSDGHMSVQLMYPKAEAALSNQ